MKNIFNFIKKHKFLSLFIILFIYYNCFSDLFAEKAIRTFLGARIFVLFQKITPLEARKLVVQESKMNPELKDYPHESGWWRMYVSGNEYFFPARWPRDTMNEYGYYVNPKTGKVRYVSTYYYFRFPFLIDRCSIQFTKEEINSQMSN